MLFCHTYVKEGIKGWHRYEPKGNSCLGTLEFNKNKQQASKYEFIEKSIDI